MGLLRRDPGSWVAAALEQWEYPVSREAAILMDSWDLEYLKTGAKKRVRYPRPYPGHQQQQIVRRGDAAGRAPEQVKAILRSQFGQPASSV